ncbi:MAG TPA: Ku protein [Xanthomonadaceae bacterium]|nr:Ku protein [Xanthomonadaceae bacterium]
MAATIWTGTLSFGLLHVPVKLMPGERSVDLHFRMLDSRNNARVRYERVNAETGEEVPWKDIVKAFEYDKGNYVVLDPDDIKSASSEGKEAVEIEAFVNARDIDLRHYEKPYVLVPGKKAEKGYVLLRETLRKTGKAGIARVVVRQREYLSAVLPHGDAIILMLLRYQQEIVSLDEFKLPEGKPSDYRVTPKEIEMATQLIESMSVPWNPDDYQDDYRERLRAVIDKRMKSEGVVSPEVDDEVEREGIATNVVDFESLLKKSISENKRTPAKKSAAKKAPAKAPRKTTKAARKPAGRKRKSA